MRKRETIHILNSWNNCSPTLHVHLVQNFKSSTFLSVFFDMLLYYTHPKWNRVVLPLCIQVKLILSKYKKAWCSFRKWFLLGFVLAEYILGFDQKYYCSFTFSHLFRPLYWVENTILVTKVKKWKLLSFFIFIFFWLGSL